MVKRGTQPDSEFAIAGVRQQTPSGAQVAVQAVLPGAATIIAVTMAPDSAVPEGESADAVLRVFRDARDASARDAIRVTTTTSPAP